MQSLTNDPPPSAPLPSRRASEEEIRETLKEFPELLKRFNGRRRMKALTDMVYAVRGKTMEENRHGRRKAAALKRHAK